MAHAEKTKFESPLPPLWDQKKLFKKKKERKKFLFSSIILKRKSTYSPNTKPITSKGTSPITFQSNLYYIHKHETTHKNRCILMNFNQLRFVF